MVGNHGAAKRGMTGQTEEPLLQNLTHHILILTSFTNHNHLQTVLIAKTTNMCETILYLRTKNFMG